MVYCGKPSRACQNCKTRRIKCDEGRPACGQCIKSKRSCPGYPDEFDLIFRNETAAVKRRAHKNSANLAVKTTSPKAEPSKSSSSPVDEESEPNGGAVVAYNGAKDEEYIIDDDVLRNSSSYATWTEDTGAEYFYYVDTTTKDVPISQSPWEDRHILGPDRQRPSQNVLLSPRSLDSARMRIDNATAFWFRHLLTMPKLPDSLRGYLEVLAPLYTRARPNSILHQATHALALAGISNGRKSALLRLEARKLYAKALQNAGEVIRDPKQARSDETLMAIMLFALYETIISAPHIPASPGTSAPMLWNRHIAGAIALAKLRGEKMKDNPISLRLFQAVRTHMLTAAIQQQKTIEDFPGSKGWFLDEDMEVNAANRLTLICMDLPNIKYHAQELLRAEKTQSTIVEIMKLIRLAKSTDNTLEHWALTLDPVWEPAIRFTIPEEPENIATAPCWKGPVYVYQDLSVANVWTDYRLSRVFCQAIILGCVAALPYHLRSGQIQRVADQAIFITQQMADDFTSTVPFLFGLPSEFEARKIGPIDQIAWRASGAYYSAWPLWVMRKTPTLPENQKKWLSARFLLIGKTWGLTEDQMLNVSQRQAVTTGPSFSYEEFGDLKKQHPVTPKPCAVEYVRPMLVGGGIGLSRNVV